MKIDIHDSNGNVRSRELEFGSYVIGSDFDCDIVLVDEGIAPKHLQLTYAKDGMKVAAIEDAEACFAKNDSPMDRFSSDKPLAWKGNHEVWIADLVIRKQAPAKKRFRLFRPTITGGLAVGALAAVVTFFPTQDADGLAISSQYLTPQTNKGETNQMAPVSGTEDMPEMMPVAQSSIMGFPSTALKMTAESPMVEPEQMMETKTSLGTDIYVEDVNERDQIKAEMASIDPSENSSFHLKTQLMSAINIVLNAISVDAKVENLEDGVLLLSSKSLDRDRYSEIEAALMQDVPGLRAVQFIGTQAPISEEIVELVIGIWHSSDSYIILSDGRTVRPGEEIENGVTLEKVDSMSEFTVSRDNVEERMSL